MGRSRQWTGYHMPSRCQPAWRFRHSRRLGVTDKRWHCSMLHGWSAQRPRPRRSSPRCSFPTPYGAGGHELCLEPPEWKAHEAVRVRLRGGLALVRGCLKPRKRWGMCLSLRALETGTGTVYVVQQRCRARGLHSHPGAAACTSRAEAASRPRALTALIVNTCSY